MDVGSSNKQRRALAFWTSNCRLGCIELSCDGTFGDVTPEEVRDAINRMNRMVNDESSGNELIVWCGSDQSCCSEKASTDVNVKKELFSHIRNTNYKIDELRNVEIENEMKLYYHFNSSTGKCKNGIKVANGKTLDGKGDAQKKKGKTKTNHCGKDEGSKLAV